MPRVRIPRYAKLLKSSWQGSIANPHTPAKTIAVRKLTTTHGAIAQQKAQAVGYQLQDCRTRKTPVTNSIRAFTPDRNASFAAKPYLEGNERRVKIDTPVQPRQALGPPPSFAARPVWQSRGMSTAASPEPQQQGALRAKLARRVPLYAYAQLQATRGISKVSAAGPRPAKPLAAVEKAALSWYAAINQAQTAGRGMIRTGARAASTATPAALKGRAKAFRAYAQLDGRNKFATYPRRSGPAAVEKKALRWYGSLSK